MRSGTATPTLATKADTVTIDVQKEYVLNVSIADSITPATNLADILVKATINGTLYQQKTNSTGVASFKSSSSAFTHGAATVLQLVDPSQTH